jgi:hypothetical protein
MFTQNVADTWEYKTITIPGDVTGTWVGNTNGGSLYVRFGIAVGATYQGTPGNWGVPILIGGTSSTNGVAATSDVFQITGVCMLPGTVAPSAAQSSSIKRLFDQELQLCQRYYEKSYDYWVAPGAASVVGDAVLYIAANVAIFLTNGQWFPFKIPKRTSPTITAISPITGAAGKMYDYVNSVDVAATADHINSMGHRIYAAITLSSVIATGVHFVADTRL